MKKKNRNAMYKIDSCHKKIICQTNDICNKPSYHTVCYKPIVDRNLLTHSDYLKMLSTPRGFKWADMPSYYKKRYNSYRFHKRENEKYNVNGQQKISYEKRCSVLNKTMNNQTKINDILNLNNNNNNNNNKSKKIQNQQKKFSQSINKNGIGNDLKNKNDSLIHKHQDSSNEKLGKIKDQQETDSFLKKKKKLWLQAEKKRKKREEKENKFKLSIQEKQKKKEEQKKIMEEKIKMKLKHNQILEEQRKQKIQNEKEEMAKAQVIAKKKKLEENEILSKEAERLRKLEALKQEAKRIEEEEEAWRKKINHEFALKMGFTMNLNIVNKKNEHSMCNKYNGKKKLTRYTDKLLKEIKQNNQVFDSGNLMKEIIKRKLNNAEKKKIKHKSGLQVCEPCNKKKNDLIMIKTKEKKDLSKETVFKKYYVCNNIIDSKNNRLNQLTEVKSNEHSILKKPKNMLKCKIPDVHCYSNTSFNTLVCDWKNEVVNMITNMQNHQYNCTK